MMNEKNDFEIERKYIIELPDFDKLKKLYSVKILNIVQSYVDLNGEYDHGRVRKIIDGNGVYYYLTIKKKITDLTRIEIENRINYDEYTKYLRSIEKNTNEVSKTRYVIYFEGFNFEIDVYPFWKKQAFCEIELKSEDEQFGFPPEINVIKEVTHDSNYTNHSIAKGTMPLKEFI